MYTHHAVQYDDDVQRELAAEDVWALPQPEPTNLVALWGHHEMPRLEDVLAALQAHLDGPVELLDELDTDAAEIQWTAAIKLPQHASLTHPLMLWVEPARDNAQQPTAAAGCRWAIGVETLLDQQDPLQSYAALIRTLAGAFPAVPAILDVNTTIWRDRDALERDSLLDRELGPLADVLWVIQAVAQRSNQPHVWLHTHGLWRCGLPELEMLEVPEADASAAAMLLNDIAEMTLEQRPSPPGATYEIGGDLRVSFQQWEALSPYVPDGVPGGMADREGERNVAHSGVRAVICDEKPLGQYRQLWTWPQQALGKLQRGETGLFLTQRAAHRQATLARRTWNILRQAFASAGARDDAAFLIKAGFNISEATEHEPPPREHLWLAVQCIDTDQVQATLLNDPAGDLSFRSGEQVTVNLAQVSDWEVRLGGQVYSPQSAANLQAALTAST